MITERPKLKNILISPLVPISEFEEYNPIYRSDDFKESIRRGYIPNFFLLKEIDLQSIQKEICIINFREIFFIKFEKILKRAIEQGQRIRLKSPYRESLSQAFGKFIMRVGYPEEISIFTKQVRVSGFDENL